MAHHLRLVARSRGTPAKGAKLTPVAIVACVDEDAAVEVRAKARADGYSCSSRAAEIRTDSAIADVVLVTVWGAP